MKKAFKIGLWIIGAVLLLLVLLSLAGGSIAKSYLNRHGKQLTGREMHVDHIGLNLLTGHVGIHHFSIYEDDEATLFAGFDTLDIGLRLLALPFRTVHVGHLDLCGLQVHLLQQGEQFNFSSLVDHFASDDTTPHADKKPWTVRLRKLHLSHAGIDYRDLQSSKAFDLPDINLRVPGFTLGGHEQSEGGINIGFANGGRLNVDAHYNAQLHRYSMQAELSQFALKNVEALVADALHTERLRGQLQASLYAEGEVSHLLSSRIGGKIALHDLDIHNAHGKLASMDTMLVAVNNINLDRNTFDVAKLLVAGLDVKMHHYAADTTADTVETPAPTSPPTSTATKPALQLAVGDIEVRRSSMTYIDHTLPDRMELPLTGITLASTNFSNRGINNATLRATLPGGGKLTLRWQGMIDQWKHFQEVQLSINGFEMKRINPLVATYTGREFTDGVLGLNSSLRIDRSLLDNTNHLDIYKASVGKRRKDITPQANVPLKTALYVLKDKNDRILIDMPISGNIDAPEFNYMHLVWKTLGQLLVKVATSPARALAGALGMGSDGLDFIDISPTQDELTSEQYHTLSRLATLAQQDKKLILKLQRPTYTTADSLQWQHLDGQIIDYMQGQGIGKRQLVIATADSLAVPNRTGYAVESELLIDE